MLKTLLLGLACFFTLNMQAMEYEVHFQNEHLSAIHAKILPHEEIGLHRDEYPQVVVALKGGVITRLEANGTTTEVSFPTHHAIYRPMDPPDEFHRSVNNSDEPVELIIIQLKSIKSAE
jgi:hypothetical protein